MKYHNMSLEQTETALNTSFHHGLTSDEVKKRRKQFGFNELHEEEKQSAILLFFSQFKDFMVIVLLIATLISGILGEYIDAIAILAIVFLNGLLGFFQERKAEKSLQALKELSSPEASVLRNGKWQKIPSKEIVPGDIVRFASGDRICADVRLFEANNLEMEESALTGESVPVEKDTSTIRSEDIGIGDMRNMAFMGTMVTRGSGKGVVIGTGMKTAMGQIADLLQTAETMQTPLQRRLEQLGKILIAVALILTLLVVIIGVLQGHDLYTMFLSGVSLAVAAIPEGLPAIVTIVLSLGVQRMIKKNAIVRKLSAVETLGCASVICSDKTGTMTQNKMTVTHLWANNQLLTATGQGYDPQGHFYLKDRVVNPVKDPHFNKLLTFGMLCNHAVLVRDKDQYRIDGDPTEGALLVAAMKAGFSREHLLNEYKIVQEFPFDSERKMMTVIIEDKKGNRYAVTKGAPDVLIRISGYIYADGKKQYLSNRWANILQNTVDLLASKALRTIAGAYKPVPKRNFVHEKEVENDLIFIGLEGMMDPPRPEVKRAIEECKNAGIKTIMITGDYAQTARAIGKELGLLRNDSLVINGSALNKMSVVELEEIVDRVTVFARVSPEHKLKIVKALQNKGHIVAMTGDGVNDAPAIKAADIGIAMGITGTDVAKESSAMVLLDDNFATIKAAIQEGRNIYENIRKFIRYLLASNVGEILVMLFAMILALPLPLVPIQILWVNLVTDGLPAMALGLDQPEEDVMKRSPRHPNEGIFARRLGWKIISRGFLIGIATLFAFIAVYKQNPGQLEYAQTVAFATLVLAHLIPVFDCRSEHSIFARNPFENKYLVWAVISSIVLTLIVIYYPPLQTIFHTVPVVPRDWLLIIAMASIPTFLLAGSLFLPKK